MTDEYAPTSREEALRALEKKWREVADKQSAKADYLNESGDSSDAAWCEGAAEHRYYCADEIAAILATASEQAPVADGLEFFAAPEDLHPETVNLVARFAAALAEKLAIAQRKYGWDRHWQSPEWMDQCREQLVAHVAKGDPRDVAAYCAFLWHHGESTTSPAHTSEARDGYVLVSIKDAEKVARFAVNNSGNGLRSEVGQAGSRIFDALSAEVRRKNAAMRQEGGSDA